MALIFFLLIYYEQRYTVHYLNANLERRSVTPDVVVCAVEGKYVNRSVQGMTPKQEALAKNVYFSKEAIVCWILDENHAPKEEVSGAYYPDHPDPVKAKTGKWVGLGGDMKLGETFRDGAEFDCPECGWFCLA